MGLVQEYPAAKYGGHLVLADDIIIDHCQLQHLNASKVNTSDQHVSVRQHYLLLFPITGPLMGVLLSDY